MLAIIAPPSLLAGVIGGGVLGALHHKGLGLKAEDRDRIAAELTDGKAAVGVLAADVEATEVSAKLTELGGREVLTVSEEAAPKPPKWHPRWRRPRPPHPARLTDAEQAEPNVGSALQLATRRELRDQPRTDKPTRDRGRSRPG